MGFSNKRGRPRKEPEAHAATPQLLARQKQGRLREPLDALLWEGVIDAAQHAAGLRLRHQRAAVFGVATPTSAFHWLPRGNTVPMEEARRERLSLEYAQLRAKLQSEGCWVIICRWCFAENGAISSQAEIMRRDRLSIQQSFTRLSDAMRNLSVTNGSALR